MNPPTQFQKMRNNRYKACETKMRIERLRMEQEDILVKKELLDRYVKMSAEARAEGGK